MSRTRWPAAAGTKILAGGQTATIEQGLGLQRVDLVNCDINVAVDQIDPQTPEKTLLPAMSRACGTLGGG